MANVEARIKIQNKHYELMVDLDEALKVKAGKGNVQSAIQSPNIFYDLKKGTLASKDDLTAAFGTTDVYAIATKIIASGEVQKTQEFRDEERERKVKQVMDIILRNATDQHGRPYTEERLRNAVNQTHFNFDNSPPENQSMKLLAKLQEIIPIKIETKKVKIRIPANYTGKVYGMVQENKESEEWLSNGDLEVVMNIPAGLLIDFYDKLNSATHGAIQSTEMN